MSTYDQWKTQSPEDSPFYRRAFRAWEETVERHEQIEMKVEQALRAACASASSDLGLSCECSVNFQPEVEQLAGITVDGLSLDQPLTDLANALEAIAAELRKAGR